MTAVSLSVSALSLLPPVEMVKGPLAILGIEVLLEDHTHQHKTPLPSQTLPKSPNEPTS